MILDYYYREQKNLNNIAYKSVLSNLIEQDVESVINFYLFPITILTSLIGYLIAYNFKTFLPHVLLSIISLILNIYLMFYYMRRLSFVVTLFLMPLLVWQFFNILFFINDGKIFLNLEDDKKKNKN